VANAQSAGAEAAYAGVLERARADPEVVGVVVFGSRAAGPFATPTSDVDAFVVLTDDAVDPDRWHTPHGSPVEIWAIALDAFREHGLAGSTTAWNRPAFLRARVDLDKLDGEIERIVARKRRLDAIETDAAVRNSVDDFVNAAYRALHNL
jgi:predicted nucleotidyltransferase